MDPETTQTAPAEQVAPQPVPEGAASDQSSSQSADEQSQPSLFDRLFRRKAGTDAQTGAGATDDKDGEAATKPKPEAPNTNQVSTEELERRVQAEVDRRESKRQAAAQREQLRSLRANDPVRYAEAMEQQEQQQESAASFGSMLGDLAHQFDSALLDPVVSLLPNDEQQKIIQAAGAGIEGRKAIVGQALKSLEAKWKAEGAKEAEANLRKNGSFRKQLLVELRGTQDEPDVIPSGQSASPVDMNTLIRNMGHYRK